MQGKLELEVIFRAKPRYAYFTPFRHLAGLRQLQSLTVGGCFALTDAGMSHIATLDALVHLNAANCFRVTDAGLAHVKSAATLRELVLWGCDTITTAAKNRFKSTHPQCAIVEP
jgi:hypothetical protein